MSKTILVSVAAAVTAATPAFAQDIAPTSGPRIEAVLGWDRINISVDDLSAGKGGVVYGVEAGYDFRTAGGAVLGVYAGVDDASTEQCVAGGTERACLSAGRNITAGVRFGVGLGDRALLYAKGGYSNGRLNIAYTDTALPADNFDESGDGDGFHLGTGLELSLSGGVYGKVEYNYTKYSVDDEEDLGLGLDRHRVLGGVGIRF